MLNLRVDVRLTAGAVTGARTCRKCSPSTSAMQSAVCGGQFSPDVPLLYPPTQLLNNNYNNT